MKDKNSVSQYASIDNVPYIFDNMQGKIILTNTVRFDLFPPSRENSIFINNFLVNIQHAWFVIEEGAVLPPFHNV